MGYIYQHDKRNGKTYVYEKVKKINPKTGMEVDARKIVGRLDPEKYGYLRDRELYL